MGVSPLRFSSKFIVFKFLTVIHRKIVLETNKLSRYSANIEFSPFTNIFIRRLITLQFRLNKMYKSYLQNKFEYVNYGILK